MNAKIAAAFTSLSMIALVACGSSSDPGNSRTGFGSSGNAGGNQTSGGGTGVGSGSTNGDQHGAGPGDPSTPVDPDAGTTPGDPNAPCNDLTNDATPVTETSAGTSTMPTPNGGGAPLDGHYSLTQVQHYGFTSTNDTYQASLFISSGLQQYVISKNGTETRWNALADYTGTSLTLSNRCGGSDTTLAYTTVTETQIVIYDATNKLAFTYTRPDPAEGM